MVSNLVWGEVKATVAAWRVSFGAARRVERLPGALIEPMVVGWQVTRTDLWHKWAVPGDFQRDIGKGTW